MKWSSNKSDLRWCMQPSGKPGRDRKLWTRVRSTRLGEPAAPQAGFPRLLDVPLSFTSFDGLFPGNYPQSKRLTRLIFDRNMHLLVGGACKSPHSTVPNYVYAGTFKLTGFGIDSGGGREEAKVQNASCMVRLCRVLLPADLH